jgi:site-specific recombinase XerD
LDRTLRNWVEKRGENTERIFFPNAAGGFLSTDAANYILQQAMQWAIPSCPSLQAKRVFPHVIRHSTAMHLLQSGVDITVIALWLGHESLETTHGYVQADLRMKEQALGKLAPVGGSVSRFKPDDALLAFLAAL